MAPTVQSTRRASHFVQEPATAAGPHFDRYIATWEQAPQCSRRPDNAAADQREA